MPFLASDCPTAHRIRQTKRLWTVPRRSAPTKFERPEICISLTTAPGDPCPLEQSSQEENSTSTAGDRVPVRQRKGSKGTAPLNRITALGTPHTYYCQAVSYRDRFIFDPQKPPARRPRGAADRLRRAGAGERCQSDAHLGREPELTLYETRQFRRRRSGLTRSPITAI